MNVVGKISFGLAAAVVFALAVRADDTVPSDQPYATIVARNIFGLVPPPPPPPPPAPEVDPPPKITANGIMSIFGQLQALFKVVVPAKGTQPAKEDSHMLSEGQREDDVEVVKIDEKGATITFNNHGTVQEIPLTVGQASGSVAAPGPGGPPQNPFAPGLPRFRNRPGGFPGGPPGGFGGGQIPAPMPNNSNVPSAVPTLGGSGGANNPMDVGQQAQQSMANISADEQAVLIEAERARLQTSQTPEISPSLVPPTTLNRQAGSDESGNGSSNLNPRQ